MSTHSQPHPLIDVPPQLILEVALGTEPVEDICARYGYDEDATRRLRDTPLFWRLVKDQEAEMDKNGLALKLRAKNVTEDMVGRLWTKAKTDAVPFSDKLDFAKFTAKLADLEPKTNQTPAGTGFSITFNMDGGAPASLDITPISEPQSSEVITYTHQRRAQFTPFDMLPGLNADLEYLDPCPT